MGFCISTLNKIEAIDFERDGLWHLEIEGDRYWHLDIERDRYWHLDIERDSLWHLDHERDRLWHLDINLIIIKSPLPLLRSADTPQYTRTERYTRTAVHRHTCKQVQKNIDTHVQRYKVIEYTDTAVQGTEV